MAAKKQSGFWRGVIIFLFGSACGTGAIAAVAAYVNGLHLPFIQEKAKRNFPILSEEREQNKREAVEFQSILRQQQPQRLVPAATDTPTTEPPRQYDYYLQIGAFQNENTAENLRGRISLSGHQSIIKPGTLASGGALYRVWVGPYADENSAEQARGQLALDGYSGVQLLQVTH